MSRTKTIGEWMASSTIAHVAFGFLVMGAWAVFANRDHPLPQALLAGLVQGTISGLLTLVLKKFLELMSAKMSPTLRQAQRDAGVGTSEGEKRQPEPVGGDARRAAALIVPPLVTATAILVILTTAHTLARTPEVIATIAVPFTVSTTYAVLYNLRLWRAAHGR
jgi:hypothetical protein